MEHNIDEKEPLSPVDALASALIAREQTQRQFERAARERDGNEDLRSAALAHCSATAAYYSAYSDAQRARMR